MTHTTRPMCIFVGSVCVLLLASTTAYRLGPGVADKQSSQPELEPNVASTTPKYGLADSNMENYGGAEHKAAAHEAATHEPAWTNAGQVPGVEVWRIEKFKIMPWAKKQGKSTDKLEQFGEFHEGDAYIVLNTKKGKSSEELTHDIHFWLGATSSIDEKGTAAYKTVELDDFFDGEPVQYREVQADESEKFKELFGLLVYLNGGIDSGFSATKGMKAVFQEKLFHLRIEKCDDATESSVKGRRKKAKTQMQQVPIEAKYLNHGDCFILDKGESITVWCGETCTGAERLAATGAAKTIEGTRNGKAKTELFVDKFEQDDSGNAKEKEQLEEFGAGIPAFKAEDVQPGDAVACIPDVAPNGEGSLYKLHYEGEENGIVGKFTTELVASGELKKEHLVADDVMMLVTDKPKQVLLWLGRGANVLERKQSYRVGIDFMATNDGFQDSPPPLLLMDKEDKPIENAVWNKVFAD